MLHSWLQKVQCVNFCSSASASACSQQLMARVYLLTCGPIKTPKDLGKKDGFLSAKSCPPPPPRCYCLFKRWWYTSVNGLALKTNLTPRMRVGIIKNNIIHFPPLHTAVQCWPPFDLSMEWENKEKTNKGCWWNPLNPHTTTRSSCMLT